MKLSGVMSASDDAMIIPKLIQALEANLSELAIELGEGAARISTARYRRTHLANAIKEPEALIKPEKRSTYVFIERFDATGTTNLEKACRSRFRTIIF
jgi:hypothetical protein